MRRRRPPAGWRGWGRWGSGSRRAPRRPSWSPPRAPWRPPTRTAPLAGKGAACARCRRRAASGWAPS
eukprot:scaffold10356_cov61-Phaeocystis_antarctica.AAC.10